MNDQEMKPETRILLAVVLTVVVFVVYFQFFAPAPQVPPASLQQTDDPVVQKQEAKVKEAVAVIDQKPVNTSVDPSFQAEEKEIVIETEKAFVTVSTRGAQLIGYQLKDYKTSVEDNAAQKDLLTETENSSALFLGVDGYPNVNDGNVFQVVNDTTAKTGERSLVLAWQDKNLRVEKTFIFGGASPYGISQSYRILNRSQTPLQLKPYFRYNITQKEIEEDDSWFSFLTMAQADEFGSLYLKEDSLEAQILWQDFEDVSDAGAIRWAGVADRYFLMATFVPKKTLQNISYEKDAKSDALVAKVFSGETVLNPGTSFESTAQSYFGPKLLNELNKFDVGLDHAIDYGWFGFVAYPILWTMTFFHNIIPNWGLVIILLTFVFKMLLHPVNKKSLTSMKAMQQLQPKMKEIREKHKNDRVKQNEEVMQLFRTHKVNPMGGCLPMVLQMPIYIALYKVLWNAIELYHTPFWFYPDLSAADPYFILPVLLGVFMFLQQKLTPSPSADPSQKKLMMIMPVMFMVFMVFLPVGLVLYILVNTVMSVIQQYMLHNDIRLRDLVRGRVQPKANGA